MKKIKLILLSSILSIVASTAQIQHTESTDYYNRKVIVEGKVYNVKFGNYHIGLPYAISTIINDETGYVISPDWMDSSYYSSYTKKIDAAIATPGITSADFSFCQSIIKYTGANIKFTWGRLSDGCVGGIIESDKPTDYTLTLTGGWYNFHNSFRPAKYGFDAWSITPFGEYIPFTFRCNDSTAKYTGSHSSNAYVKLKLEPGKEVCFVSGLGTLYSLSNVKNKLAENKLNSEQKRIHASGDWGDFAGAVAENSNFYRLYSDDNNAIVHSIGRGWWIQRDNPDLIPYFVWDLCFQAMMASPEDLEGAKNTIRTVFSFQNPEGFVPSFSHWDIDGDYVTTDRSMPPVASLCVWKIYEHWQDKEFLREVYPNLVRWHNWWPKYRDGNKNGLLEWGSGKGVFWAAQLETGWDDNVHYLGAEMEGTQMNADAVDLNSLWAMDTEYLEKIAAVLNEKEDEATFKEELTTIRNLINNELWNEQLGLYCSKYWVAPDNETELDITKIAPDGFKAIYYRDRELTDEFKTQHEEEINHIWENRPAFEEVQDNNWGAIWTGSIQVPEKDTYRLKIISRDGIRLWLDDKILIDRREQDDYTEKHFADVELEKDKKYQLKIEYFDKSWIVQCQFKVMTFEPGEENARFLDRITLMNFYPLISGAPTKGKAEKALEYLYNEDKFWGEWLLSTVPYDDPVWPDQTYWRGHICPPANYSMWQGLSKYADKDHKADLVRKSIELFMLNWNESRNCCENYKSTDGSCNTSPNYLWGALLARIGIEALVEINASGNPVPRSNINFNEDVKLEHIPYGGQFYTIEMKGGQIEVIPE